MLYVPGPQFVHCACACSPDPELYVPGPQFVHCPCACSPTPVLYVPAPHGVHWGLPWPAAKLPAPHLSQVVNGETDVSPGLQSVHAEAPAEDLVPAPQAKIMLLVVSTLENW